MIAATCTSLCVSTPPITPSPGRWSRSVGEAIVLMVLVGPSVVDTGSARPVGSTDRTLTGPCSSSSEVTKTRPDAPQPENPDPGRQITLQDSPKTSASV